MKTLDIRDKLIRNTWKKVNECGILEKEKHGINANKPKLSEQLKNSIREHINSFPLID